MIWLAGLSLLCAGVPTLLFLVNLLAYQPPARLVVRGKRLPF